MHAHIIETPQTATEQQPDDPLVSGTAVGTFAAGQADHGSIHVAADAEVGSFASGTETGPPVTA